MTVQFVDSLGSLFFVHLLAVNSVTIVHWIEQIFGSFLHSEYGGPGTLLVNPFADMADAVSERGLPGGPQAARVAVKWAQNHVDKDWNEWTGGGDSN